MEQPIQLLIERFLDNSLSPQDREQLDEWINRSPSNRLLFEKLINPSYLSGELQQLYSYSENEGWNKVQEQLLMEKPVQSHLPTQVGSPVRSINWRPWVAAACVSIGIFIAGNRLLNNKSPKPSANPGLATAKTDVAAPVISKAMIQLANGRMIPVDSIDKGLIAEQGPMQVMKNAEGEIVYKGEAKEEIYNTIVNPRGSRVVRLSLQDGTKVWLNSETTLRYPVAFTGDKRQVQVTGEAYFEVAKDKDRKFIVQAGDLATEVLGTHFNVNTYDQSGSAVTLLEGSIKVSKGPSTNILVPGQQAAYSNASQKLSVSTIDPEKIMAWHAGIFYFDDDRLTDIMQELSRWYDVNIEFKSVIPPGTFGGIISREESLFSVLKALNTSGVKFEMKGKTIKIGE